MNIMKTYKFDNSYSFFLLEEEYISPMRGDSFIDFPPYFHTPLSCDIQSTHSTPSQVRSHFDRQCIEKTLWTCLRIQWKRNPGGVGKNDVIWKSAYYRHFSCSHFFSRDINTTHSTCAKT